MERLTVTGKKLRGGDGSYRVLRGDGVLEIGDGRARLHATYDPPGSGWLATLATAITFAAILLIAPVAGFAAGPGWLPWFLLIRYLRARPIEAELDANNVEAVVVDDARVAIRTSSIPDTKPGWFGLLTEHNPSGALATVFGSKLRGDSVQAGIPTIGLMLIGLGVVTAATMTLANFAIPKFEEYVEKSKNAEAPMQLRALASGIENYAMSERVLPDGRVEFGVLPESLPRTPAKPPCDREMWPESADPRWDKELYFRPSDPILFSYEYERGADGSSFVLRATRDPDCDGEFLVYEVEGILGDSGVTLSDVRPVD